ncbi:MAG: hypothetical protein JJU36_08355 [Phycisphaeraceae bacterium]|nr:hypothetical protein [Phycisphaeraceae bacterium]
MSSTQEPSKPQSPKQAKLPLDTDGMPPGRPLRKDWEVSPRQTHALLPAIQSGQILLVDCRTPAEHAVAQLEPVLLLPVQHTADRIDELLPHRDRPIIIFCHHGMRSLRMTSMLREAGFSDVRSMAGGIDLWSLTVDPSVPRY